MIFTKKNAHKQRDLTWSWSGHIIVFILEDVDQNIQIMILKNEFDAIY